jgi:hypothetical protein
LGVLACDESRLLPRAFLAALVLRGDPPKERMGARMKVIDVWAQGSA